MKARGILFVSFLFVIYVASGQDSLALDNVIISAQRMRLGEIEPSNRVSPLPGINDLPSNIALQGGGIYRANGTALSIVSTRGGSASQTLLLWNNLPIQSPMLGLLDYNLLPANNYDVSLHHGDAAMWGSGAISGVIALTSKAIMDRGWDASLDLVQGSYGMAQFVPKLTFSNNTLSFRHTTDIQSQKNNYPYALGNGSYDTLSNAAVDIKNFQSEMKYKLSNKAQLSVHHWYQTALRELPPTSTSTFSNGEQGDTANRIKINLDFTHKKWLLNMGLGHFDESNVYRNPLARSYGDNRFVSWISDASINYSGNKFKFLLGTNVLSTEATSLNYKEGREDQRWALFYSFIYSTHGWHINHKLRYENPIKDGSLFLPAISLGKIFGKWTLQGGINKVFRQATLNDRYWSPGGNPALLPESGWAKEINLTYIDQNEKGESTSIKLNGYSRRINNWIQWGKEDNQQFFSALNLTEVVSKGIECIANKKIVLGRFQLNQSVRYDYTLSTNQKAIANPLFAIGEQLWYVPKHQFYVNTGLKYRHTQLWVNYKYSSSSNGINRDIPAYDLYNAGLDTELRLINDVRITAGLGIFNIANEDYELMEARPMKRRNANIYFNIQI